jgi:acyl-coenzyme A thioesterase PaaI-like protein
MRTRIDPRVPPHHDPACFGCGDNPIGLRLPEPGVAGGERYEARFSFDTRHQGGPGVAHGGLVAAALDEACGLLATWYRFPAVTARMFVRYRRPVPINRELLVRAAVEEPGHGRRIRIRGALELDGRILAEARAAFLHVPVEHFLATDEGQALADAWRRRLDLP